MRHKASSHRGSAMTPSRDISRLIEIMAQLRTPVTGCPWDLAQNFATIAPYTIEEAYEVADAITRNDLADLRDELGDLLLQVVIHARMCSPTKVLRRPRARSKAYGNGSRPRRKRRAAGRSLPGRLPACRSGCRR